ncbi:hypothetical protein [Neisseria montereyensis]|uniref:Uncharacterized protein n=1 Tax=Neisseria montereyensis TaxID=2973938 RepID=A0ABT2FCN0_9NEIS|nr:hypothetical protein [Neisseria montereyensis]MCS4533310.1 hypothetical protein [Neisseria montereyensis]
MTFNYKDVCNNESNEAKGLQGRLDLKEFYKSINNAIIDWICIAEDYKDLLCNHNEDSISLYLVIYLKGFFKHQYEIEHDCHQGGHVDISIKRDRYRWIGEAKVSKGSTYSLKGFEQLVNRYSSGSPTCSEGGLLLYITNKSAQNKKSTDVLQEWKKNIEQEIDDLTIDEPDMARTGLSFISRHTHHTSGLEYTVHHHVVQLQHFPTD